MSSTSSLNDVLTAQNIYVNGLATDELDVANEALRVQNNTVIGYEVGGTVNGVLSLDIATGSNGGDASQSVAQVTGGTLIPDISGMSVDVSSGTFTTTDSDITIDIISVTNGEIDSDGSGNITTVSSVIGQVAVVTSTGTDAVSTVTSTIKSLTGVKPPDESIEIIALGGGAINELTASVTEAVKRKSSLISEIQSSASAASLDGLGNSISGALDSAVGELNDHIDSSGSNFGALSQLATDAVSAVEGVGNSVASAAAVGFNAVDSVIGQTIGQVTSIIEDGFQDALSDIGSAIDGVVDSLLPDVDTGFGFAQDLFEDITGSVGEIFQGIFSTALEITPDVISSVMKDVLEGGDINLTNATRRLALLDKNIGDDMKQIIETSEGSNPVEFEAVVETRAKAKSVPQSQIDSFKTTRGEIAKALSKVDTTISGTIVAQVGEFYTEDTDLADLIKRYLAADTESFAFVDSKEELGLEFYRMERAVSELIVHATETYTNANIGSEEIHLRHKEAGHGKGIQYHYVIRRDGRLQRGMPLDETGDASNVRGHAKNCIDVALVGGVNVPSNSDNPLENLSAQSFTQAQMKTLEAIIESFYIHQPGGQVFGHNAIDLANEDPYFDVVSYVENKFGKKTVYKDLLKDQSLSPKELVSKKPV